MSKKWHEKWNTLLREWWYPTYYPESAAQKASANPVAPQETPAQAPSPERTAAERATGLAEMRAAERQAVQLAAALSDTGQPRRGGTGHRKPEGGGTGHGTDNNAGSHPRRGKPAGCRGAGRGRTGHARRSAQCRVPTIRAGHREFSSKAHQPDQGYHENPICALRKYRPTGRHYVRPE
jgi:hypothetical protein